jgi:hypothetical protein
MAEGYTQKEIDLMMVPVHEKLDTIIEQVKATNGRVRCLERWRSFITGGLAVLTVVIIPIIVAVLR